MNDSSSPDRTAVRRLDILLLVALSALVFLPGIGGRDVWSPDEPRYAQVSREMLETGEFLVPHINGRIYDQKPPLFFWTVAATGALLGGVDAAAVRLPSALAALGCTLLVFQLAVRFAGRRAGWLSATVFLTFSQILWQGRIGQIDMLLTLLVGLAMGSFIRGYTEGRSGFYRLFFVFTGLATLAKGPVGLLPPLLAVVLFLLWRRDTEALRSFRPLTGLAIWLLVVAAWLLPAGADAGVEYVGTMTLTQNLTRYAAPAEFGGTQGHIRPWHHYLETIPAGTVPWSLLLPFAVWHLLRDRQSRNGTAVLLPFCWALVTFVFFSLSPAKRSVYVVTMFPALALLVGQFLDRAVTTWPRHRRLLIASLGFGCLVALGLWLAIPIYVERHPEVAGIAASSGGAASAFALVFVLGSVASLVLAWLHRPRVAVATMAAGLMIAAPALTVLVLPGVDELKSPRPFAERVRSMIGPDADFVWAPVVQPAVLFYLGRSAPEIGGSELASYVAAREHPWVITHTSDLRHVPEGLGLQVCAREQERRSALLLGRCAGGEPLASLRP